MSVEREDLRNTMVPGAETRRRARRSDAESEPPPTSDLQARLAAARAAKPAWRLDDSAHCGHCLGTGWDEAWDAAIRTIEGN